MYQLHVIRDLGLGGVSSRAGWQKWSVFQLLPSTHTGRRIWEMASSLEAEGGLHAVGRAGAVPPGDPHTAEMQPWGGN